MLILGNKNTINSRLMTTRHKRKSAVSKQNLFSKILSFFTGNQV